MEETNKTSKLSYEELENVAQQISQQNQALVGKLKEANKVIEELNDNRLLNRLSFLFRVVEHADLYPADFVEKCTVEVITLMTLPEEESPEENK